MTVSSKHLSILICGDYAPHGRFEEASRRSSPSLFGELAQHIGDSDISCLNLEAPLLAVPSPRAKVGPVLTTHPDSLNSVVAAGFDTITLANNHILDHGERGLKTTLDTCGNAGLLTVGAGANESNANEPLFIERNGIRVGLLSFAEQEFNAAGPQTGGAAILDPSQNILNIIETKESCHALVLILHGGNELYDLPRPGLRKLCHLYASIGADAIVCHHPHVVGAYENVEGVPIHYSLGNFVFDRKNPPNGWNEGYAVRLNIEVNCDGLVRIAQELFPYEQKPEICRLKLLGVARKERFMRQMDERNRTLQDPTAYERHWLQFCDSISNNILSRLAMPRKFKGSERLFRALGLKSIFFSRRVANDKLNLLRCPSHREVLIQLMEKL